MIQIPQYRAKKIDSNEYKIGFLLNDMIITGYQLKQERDGIYWHSISSTRIDPSTLAIHFPDMLDSQGNKIFASLSEDSKGGDILHVSGSISYVPYYSYGEIRFEDFPINLRNCKVIGVQE